MIIVTGTGRSGTSMWMQIFKEIGLPVVGEAFPHDWDRRFGHANPEGFYESTLVEGVNFSTNPNPRTGALLVAEETRQVAVKIFAQGLRRTEASYIDRVIVSMRHWSSFRRSSIDFYEVLRRERERSGGALFPIVPPVLKWWGDHYAMLDDARRRGYPHRVVSYESVLSAPERVVPEVAAWVGAEGDLPAGIATVKPSLDRARQARAALPPLPTEPVDGVPVDCLAVLDQLFSTIHQGLPLDRALWSKLDEVELELRPMLESLEQNQQALRWNSKNRSPPS